MGSISNVLSSSTRHISVSEFGKSLSRVLSLGKSHHGGKHGTIGLAISGGVDSMALAVLCSKIQALPLTDHEHYPEDLQTLQNISFKAFIVDHQVRDGSYEEAKAVSRVLEQRGITAEILRIKWPETQSSSSSNFESLARRYRFRLLGKACFERGINSLLLAHHEADQVETIMMRLIAGHRRAGLVGIKEEGGIPECYGIHGVYESGGLSSSISTHSQQPGKASANPGLKQLDVETGGIQIYRPMLGFSKDRLIATCKHEKMKWFEDHTNKDPTLTKRNAIRHIYSNHAVPAALSKPALLDLSGRIKDSISQENTLVAQSQMKMVKNFNTRVGTAKIEFAPTEALRKASEEHKLDPRRIAAKLLRRALFLVSPLEHIELSSLDNAITHNFSGLSRNDKQVLPKPFTIASVYLQPDHTESGKTQWLLSRQSYHTSSALPSIHLTLDEINTWTPWHLYDGRYWIRIQSLDTRISSLVIRPFQKCDLKRFKDSLSPQGKRALVRAFKDSAAGDIRWTLPAFGMCNAGGEEGVLALPTMDFSAESASSLLNWEVRYKKVKLPEVEWV